MTMTKNDALLPCFCGRPPIRGMAKKTSCQMHGEPSQQVTLHCRPDCFARPFVSAGDVYNGGKEKAYQEADKIWNDNMAKYTRPTPAPLSKGDEVYSSIHAIIEQFGNEWEKCHGKSAEESKDKLIRAETAAKQKLRTLRPSLTPSPVAVDAKAGENNEWFFRWAARAMGGSATADEAISTIFHHPENPYANKNPWETNMDAPKCALTAPKPDSKNE